MGILVGFTGYYLVRKNFSMVMPDLIERGYTKADLGIALSAISVSNGTSKLVIGGYLAVAMPGCSFLGPLLSALTIMVKGFFPCHRLCYHHVCLAVCQWLVPGHG